MKPYPSPKVEIQIHDKLQFERQLRGLLGSKFRGTITDEGFRLQMYFDHSNTFRPIIKGKYSEDNHTLKLSIELNRIAVILLLVGILFSVLGMIQSGKYFFVIPAVAWVFLWYFLGWIFYSIDLKKTKAGLQRVIELADVTPPDSPNPSE